VIDVEATKHLRAFAMTYLGAGSIAQELTGPIGYFTRLWLLILIGNTALSFEREQNERDMTACRTLH